MITAVWSFIHSYCSPYVLFVVFTMAVHMMVFWSACVMLMALDLTQKPRWLYNFKIQRDKCSSLEDYKKAAQKALVNQLIGFLFASLVFYICDLLGIGLDMGPELPSLLGSFCRIFGFVFVEEILFFYLHRMFHTRQFYRRFHSVHHEFTAPIGISAIYAHPVEHIVVNLFPLLLGPILLRAHVVELWFWLAIATLDTINSHCGYYTPQSNPAFHDFHHESFRYNFGVLGLLDTFHGTLMTKESISVY
mmetsp:Transcript_22699/g.28981  ORF Transcript_22699/g.28981 Transcript_22699/m.28981 type:complete len:248 (-) Transcript_22699:50-793(-)